MVSCGAEVPTPAKVWIPAPETVELDHPAASDLPPTPDSMFKHPSRVARTSSPPVKSRSSSAVSGADLNPPGSPNQRTSSTPPRRPTSTTTRPQRRSRPSTRPRTRRATSSRPSWTLLSFGRSAGSGEGRESRWVGMCLKVRPPPPFLLGHLCCWSEWQGWLDRGVCRRAELA